MPIDIVLTIAVTAFIQSIFGVGVLLFGTPVLLALGYDFIQVITILLPISFVINIFQIVKDFKFIDFGFYKRIICYSLPFIVLFLLMVTKVRFNIGILVGLYLLLIALKDFFDPLKEAIQSLTKHEKIYLILLGIIHGMTNLGGSLLAAIVQSKQYEKVVSRATIAASYATFAAFQIATLYFSAHQSNMDKKNNLMYLIVGICVFFITELTIYKEINNQRYSRYFAVFLFISGVSLCIRSI